MGLAARGVLAAALLAPRITGAGIRHRRTARKWIYPSLTQKGQTQQQKSDGEEALHGTSHRVFTSISINVQENRLVDTVAPLRELAVQEKHRTEVTEATDGESVGG